jgi:hypothetical protein
VYNDSHESEMKTSPSFKLDQVNKSLLHKQYLAAPTQDADLARTVEEIGGLHATGATTPYLSLWVRRGGFAKEELQEALHNERSLGKVLCMRNTLFILPKDLLPTAYQATKKQREALLSRWLRHRGLTRQEYELVTASIREALGNTAKTAAEIRRELDDPSLAALVDFMPNDWQLIRGRPRGTWRSNLYEYSAFEAWFSDVDLESLTAEEAQVKLVQHYLSHLGPATEEDIVWWTGLGKQEIRQALALMRGQLVEIEIEGLRDSHLALTKDLNELETSLQSERPAFLLPSLDPYVMGYKDRRRFLDQVRYEQVFDRAGNALPTVWFDGEVIGVWLEDSKKPVIETFLFEDADKRILTELDAEAQRLARFLEHDPANVQISLYPDGAYPKSPFTLAQKK